jgi:imidazolonepropionase-like amidohydrolase
MRACTALIPFLFAVRAAGAQDRLAGGAIVFVPPPLVLTHANVIDGVRQTPLRDVNIVIRGGRIESIGAAPLPGGAGIQTIDLHGRWVLPGLIDAHVHIASLANAQRALESGVTTVRSASVPHYEDVALRELAHKGVIPGPDVLASGVFVTPELGETMLADARLGAYAAGVTTTDALRAVVRINLDHGVDFIKTRGTERAGLPNTDPRKQTYTYEQLKAIVDEAATHNVPVMVHAHGDEGAYAAVKAGARSIEHGTYLSDSTLALMKQRGTFLVPTYSTVVDLIEPGGDYDNPVLRLRGQQMLPQLAATIKKARALGIKIVTGGDTDYGANSVTRISLEAMHFVELGFTPYEAIRSATVTAAELLGIGERTGTLKPGMEADLIAVEANPLEDIRALQDVTLVVSNGRVALNRLPFAKQ